MYSFINFVNIIEPCFAISQFGNEVDSVSARFMEKLLLLFLSFLLSIKRGSEVGVVLVGLGLIRR